MGDGFSGQQGFRELAEYAHIVQILSSGGRYPVTSLYGDASSLVFSRA